MTSSQDMIPIADIKENLVFLKDGSVSLVISTSAVNFSLLFETEQASIIDSFAGMLNSLSFPIQIVIRSKKLDVTSYLKVIDNAIANQKNPKLREMTVYYRKFAESTIKENNVLDKQFYVVVKAIALEMGLLASAPAEKVRKATTLLNPRRDHIVRQLSRLGLKVKQLTTPELVKLFYDIYNPEEYSIPIVAPITPTPIPVATSTQLSEPSTSTTLSMNKPVTPPPPPLPTQHPPTPLPSLKRYSPPAPVVTSTQLSEPSTSTTLSMNMPVPPPATSYQLPATAPRLTRAPTSNFYHPPMSSPLTPPFIVEELQDELGP